MFSLLLKELSFGFYLLSTLSDFLIHRGVSSMKRLVVLRLNVPVNNFSVMSGRTYEEELFSHIISNVSKMSWRYCRSLRFRNFLNSLLRFIE